MYKKSYSNLVHFLLFASFVVSWHLAAAKSLKGDISSKKSSDSISDKSTERPDDENEVKSYFRIRSQFGSKRVLDISGSYAGAVLILQDPKNTESQQWYFHETIDGWRMIRSKLYDMCLNSNGPYPAIVTWGPCDPGGPGRGWPRFIRTAINTVEMYNLKYGSVCLDVSAGNETLGGYVMAKMCNFADETELNQKWSFESINNVKAASKKTARRRIIDQKDDKESDESTERPDTSNDNKPFTIRSEFGSRRVLDISGSDDGAFLTLQDPQNTVSQQWYIDSDGWTIRSKLNGLCLNSNGPNSAMVNMGPCNNDPGSRRSRKFVYNHLSHQIENYQDDVCLDISSGNETLGGYVMTKKCNSIHSKQSNQKWSFDTIKNNVETARNKRTKSRRNMLNSLFVIRTQMSSGKVLDASKKNASPTGGTGVVMNDYNKNAMTQKWYTGADGIIRSAFNDNCLVSNGNYPALVTLELCDSRLDNKWVFNSLTQQFELASDASKCLDVIKYGCGNNRNILGGNVTEFSCHGNSNQRWILENDDSMV